MCSACGFPAAPGHWTDAGAQTPGDRLRYVILDDGQVRLMRMIPVAGLAGMLRRDGQQPVSLEDMDRALAEGAAGK